MREKPDEDPGSQQPGAGGALDRLPDMLSIVKADRKGGDREEGKESSQSDLENR